MPIYGEMTASRVSINENEQWMMDGLYSYAEIVAYAGERGNPSVIVKDGNVSNIMSDGDMVEVKPGMRFTVVHTGAA